MHGIAHSFIGKAIFALIPVSFLIGGMSGYLYSSNDSFAAKVNGETISQQDFLNRYNQEFEARAQQEGESFLAKTDSVEFVTALRQNFNSTFGGSRINPSICERIKIRCK